jgi:hypothetical protein
MNNYFNFTIPKFNEQYGVDWDDFNDIVEDNVDYLFAAIWELYWLADPDYMPLQAIEKALRALKITFSGTETTAQKKLYLRKFLTTFKDKGSADIYLDYAEAITGIRGVIYSGYTEGAWKWGETRFPKSGLSNIDYIRWAGQSSKFMFYIDVKTVDDDELDAIVEVYRLPYLLPAFYKIVLIDSSFNILRLV